MPVVALKKRMSDLVKTIGSQAIEEFRSDNLAIYWRGTPKAWDSKNGKNPIAELIKSDKICNVYLMEDPEVQKFLPDNYHISGLNNNGEDIILRLWLASKTEPVSDQTAFTMRNSLRLFQIPPMQDVATERANLLEGGHSLVGSSASKILVIANCDQNQNGIIDKENEARCFCDENLDGKISKPAELACFKKLVGKMAYGQKTQP
jgi:hypothetical protein